MGIHRQIGISIAINRNNLPAQWAFDRPAASRRGRAFVRLWPAMVEARHDITLGAGKREEITATAALHGAMRADMQELHIESWHWTSTARR